MKPTPWTFCITNVHGYGALGVTQKMYFDFHRWKISEVTDNAPVTGLNMYGNGDDFYKFTTIIGRTFRERDYLWPIPHDEILKNNLLVQNPGW